MPLSNDVRYALRLSPPGDEPGRLAGCIEHVLSGRLHRFDDAAGLVAWLQDEQDAAARAVAWLPEPAPARGP